jgi:DNA-binding NarL/FixJ family response regulator
MPREPLRVLLVDDEDNMRDVLRVALEAVCGCRVVAEATNAEVALGLAAIEQPDLVVLDHVMPGTSGADAAPALRTAAPTARIVLYSSVADLLDPDSLRAVDAVVLKGLTIGETLDAILGQGH